MSLPRIDSSQLIALDAKSALPRPERRFLIVTAPFGAFSRRLARALRQAGARCERVLLNGGDLSEWGATHAVGFTGKLQDWRGWIANYLAAEAITDLIVHGDSSFYAATAVSVASELGIGVHVFEQGYFRPHWVTLERNGVNAHSSLPREAGAYASLGQVHGAPAPQPVGRITPAAVYNISAYHLWAYLGSWIFPGYRSPYQYPAWRQCLGHIRRYAAQRVFPERSRRTLDEAMEGQAPLIIALLQRSGDSQLTRHSDFASSEDFIDRVIESFARHASADARLLFKSHPLDHGLEAHQAHVQAAASRWGMAERVFFVDDGHFPSILRRGCAVVTVNSTGGLAALELGLPTLVLGQALYDIQGLTHQGGLDSFWTTPEAPDRRLFAAYRAAVIGATQINGAFSTRRGVEMIIPEAVRRLLTRQ
ncbi:MAG: capsular biosynthesis protein [Caulobacteraceae bacterium]|nr:capsular biosynthesis protein [Caulobacteraceae bacterium]